MLEFNIRNYRPNEDEKEQASTAYLMSLVAMIIGLPMPIINLLATGLFFLMSRKSTPYVRWHCIQALISQIPLFIINNILFWWTIHILLCWTELSDAYITYFVIVNIYNIYDLVETTQSAIHSRNGKHHQWRVYGDVTNFLLKQPGVNKKLLLLKSVGSVLLFLATLSLGNTIGWMDMLHLRPTIVTDKMTEFVWNTQSNLMRIEEPNEESAKLDTMLYKLCQANDIDTTGIHIHLSSSREVNAFSTVGGHIVVNRGLIADCRSQQELCGVMAHELAHIQLGHVAENIRTNLTIMVVLAYVSGNANSSKARDILGEFIRNHMASDKENEADEKAVEYMLKAKQNPIELANFLDRMQSIGILEYMSDHPDSDRRARHITQLCKNKKVVQQNLLHPAAWEKLNKEAQ